MKSIILSLTIAAVASGAYAQTHMSSADISARLSAAGYTEIKELEFEDGVWEAEAIRADGSRAEVAIDGNGNVLDIASGQPLLTRDAVIAMIQSAGYHNVHDLDRDGAIWDADAIDQQGQRMELRVNAFDGSVLNAQVDND